MVPKSAIEVKSANVQSFFQMLTRLTISYFYLQNFLMPRTLTFDFGLFADE